jgi:hypothetical protein
MRIFSNEKFKGQPGYLQSQKVYEMIRTLLFFAISLSLFFIGYFTSNTKANLLTIIAVLGCLPASKSAVSMILFLGCKSMSGQTASEITAHTQGMTSAYDMIFTSYSKNYNICHLIIHGNSLYAYTQDTKLQESQFQKHLEGIFAGEQIKLTSIKVYTDLSKYLARLDSLKELTETNSSKENKLLEVLKSVSL